MSSYPGEHPPSTPDEQPHPGQGPSSPTPPANGQQPPAYGGPAAAVPGPPLYDAPAGGGTAWGPPPPYGQQPYAPVGPDHPRATLALVLGIVGLLGGFVCGLPLLVSPVAWSVGRGVLKDIRRSQGQLGGEGQAMAGMVMGIIGTALLVLLALALVAVVVLFLASGPTMDGSTV